VLQAVILTEGEMMIKTPTYHVFDLFKDHQDGDAVYCYSQNENMKEGRNTPMISSSASVKDGVLTLTVANCGLDDDVDIVCELSGIAPSKASARILTGDVHDHNTFDDPEKVIISDYDARIDDGKLKIKLTACSVAEVRLS